VAALAVAVAGRTPAIGHDTAVAVVVTGLVGLGALLALSPDTPARLQELLFGDVLGVTDADLVLAAGLGAIVLGALVVLHPSLLVVGFDRSSAPALARARCWSSVLPGRAPRRGAARRWSSTSRSGSSSRSRSSSPCRASATCSSS